MTRELWTILAVNLAIIIILFPFWWKDRKKHELVMRIRWPDGVEIRITESMKQEEIAKQLEQADIQRALKRATEIPGEN